MAERDEPKTPIVDKKESKDFSEAHITLEIPELSVKSKGIFSKEKIVEDGEKVDVNFGTSSLEVDVTIDRKGQKHRYYYKVNELPGEIQRERSYYKVDKHKVILFLVKKEATKWDVMYLNKLDQQPSSG